MHPNKPALYILAASHELSYVSPSTARSLLQRGIRLNPESVEIWREYVRMELGFIESLRRRWDVLGINAGDKGKKRAHGDNDVKEIDAVTQEPTGDTEDIEEVASRQDIMEGAIVKSVINSAVQGAVGVSCEWHLSSSCYICSPPKNRTFRILENRYRQIPLSAHSAAGIAGFLARSTGKKPPS